MSSAAPRPGVKYKTFSYATRLRWMGERAGRLGAEGKPDLRVAAPPEFRGEAGAWTPEDLFVAAVETCLLMTFTSLIHRKKVAVVSYESVAEGLVEFADGGYRVTRIVVRPHVVVESADAMDGARELIEKAHRSCLIANSIAAEVVVEPRIEVA